jgi:hypothetical protein
VSQEFIERITAADPVHHEPVDLILDTNVMAEIDTAGDLETLTRSLGSIEACLASPTFRWRQLRARHSIILYRWLARNRIRPGILGNEVVDIVTGKLASLDNPASYAITTAIVHIIHPFVFRGWAVGALTEVNHQLTSTSADDEILRLASRDNLPVITYEEFTERGIVPDPRKLRSKCKAKGVPVFTPQEYLAAKGVNVLTESHHFLGSLTKAMREARSKKILAGTDVLDFLVPFYRLILLDEIDGAYAHIERPT